MTIMTRNTFFTIAMMFVMTAATANAQRFGNHGGGRNEGGREMRVGRDGGVSMRGGERRSESRMEGGRTEMNHGNAGHSGHMESGRHEMNHNEGRHEMNHNGGNGFRFEHNDRGNVGHMNNHGAVTRHHDVVNHHAPAPRLDHRGYVHGWNGRVRHENGRWGYYRDNRWYWYNRYFEPDFYYGRPINNFNEYYYMPECGYIPGWEGRVCYDGGRWGYLRGNDWYWYDRYYEPDYYFAHPVTHFHHTHIGRVAHNVAAGVVGTIALGALISAICR